MRKFIDKIIFLISFAIIIDAVIHLPFLVSIGIFLLLVILAVVLRHIPKPKSKQFETHGYALAMRVLQSDLYHQLDALERAECDELIQRGMKP